MTDDKKIVDLDAVRERRAMADIEDDEHKWNMLHVTLFVRMCESFLSDDAITSAALRALIDAIKEGSSEADIEAAKKRIAQSLALFN